MDAVMGKGTTGPVYTVSVTKDEATSLYNGETLSATCDKIVWVVKPATIALYTIECGPDAVTLLLTMLQGWISLQVNGTYRMTLAGDQGYAVIKPLALGAKTTSGATVTVTTMEIVGGTVPKK